MKRVLSYLVGILIAASFLLSFLGRQDDYVVEKIIWGANQELVNLAKNTESTPKPAFEKVADKLRKVIKTFPNSNATPTAYLLLGRAYLLQKEYKEARSKFEEVISRYPQKDEMCSQATSAIASSYELEGNWSDALKAYERLKNNYPLTDLGLSVPLYIATYYATNAHSVNAQNAFEEAVRYYNRLSSEHSNTDIELKALKLLSNCYIAQQKWDEAVKVLGSILFKFPVSDAAVSVVKTINVISSTQLKDFDKATAIYQDFINKNPHHPLNKGLVEVIKELNVLKSKNAEANKSS